ncbi:MAG: hypothetical protein GXO31_05390 [Epsilonproteobacteria bacterium]|nr:hypothetical protein [Campylobacterota bacterium]
MRRFKNSWIVVAVVLSAFFLSSCKDDSLFVKKYGELKERNISSFRFKTDNYYLLDKVVRSFKRYGYKEDKNSKYLISLTSHYVINCKNPVVHAIGADFNGFVRLSLIKDKKEIYRIQKDFKTKVTDKMIDGVVKRLLKDLGIEPAR